MFKYTEHQKTAHSPGLGRAGMDGRQCHGDECKCRLGYERYAGKGRKYGIIRTGENTANQSDFRRRIRTGPDARLPQRSHENGHPAAEIG